jgi:peptidoglycan-associated lipoprotein
MPRRLYIFALLGVIVVLSGCNRKVGSMSMKEASSPEAKAPSDAAGPSSSSVREQTMEGAVVQIQGRLKDIFFDFDQASLRGDAKRALEESARFLKSKPGIKIKIEGHADERGAIEYNLALGNRRAETVRRALIQLGVEPGRLSVVSFGKEKPFCSEKSEQCYQQNRRGHFVSLDRES